MGLIRMTRQAGALSMTLLDRFRAQPPLKHADPVVRLAYVQEFPSTSASCWPRSRGRTPMRGFGAPRWRSSWIHPALGAVAGNDADESVREEARRRCCGTSLSTLSKGWPTTRASLQWKGSQDVRTLAVVAKTALRDEVALRALWRVADAHGARDRSPDTRSSSGVRLAALAALQDHGEIVSVALNSEFKDTAIAAVERLGVARAISRTLRRARRTRARRSAREPFCGRWTSARRAEAAAEQADDRSAAARHGRAAGGRCPRNGAEDDARRRETERLKASAAQALAEHGSGGGADSERKNMRSRSAGCEQQARRGRRRAGGAGRTGAAAAGRASRGRGAGGACQSQKRSPRLTQLATRAEALVRKPDVTLKAGRARVARRAGRAGRPAAAAVEARRTTRSSRRLKSAQTALTAKVQELRELTDWQRWANVGLQEQLCAKMEALWRARGSRGDRAPGARAAGAVARRERRAPRRRATRCGGASRRRTTWSGPAARRTLPPRPQARAENLAKKIALCEKAEALADSTRWIQTAEEIKRLQAEWKTIGPVTRGQEKAIWERFRDRVRPVLHAPAGGPRRAQEAMGREPREEGCALRAGRGACRFDRLGADGRRDQAAAAGMEDDRAGQEEPVGGASGSGSAARAIASSSATRSATTSPAPNGWRRARRSAPSSKRSSRSDRKDANRSERVADRAARGRCARCARAGSRRSPREASIASGPLALDQRFAAAFARVVGAAARAFAGSDLDPDANRKRMETLVRRVEELATLLGAGSAASRRRAVAHDPCGGDAEGSAGGEHDRRKGRRRQPDARRRRRGASGAGEPGRASVRCRTRCATCPARDQVQSCVPTESPSGGATARWPEGWRSARRAGQPTLVRLFSSSTSNTSIPVGVLLALVGEALGNPEARLLALDHQLHAFGPARDHAVSGNVAGSPRDDRAVEHLPVGRPAGVVHRHRVWSLWAARCRCPAVSTL